MPKTKIAAPAPGWLPLEVWMQRDRVTPSELLKAERAGAQIPAVNFRGSLMVDLSKLYDWHELAALLVKVA